MKQIIKDVLEDMSIGQVNLVSDAARELVAMTISAALKTKGKYIEYTDDELDIQDAKGTWVCSICGKSTFETDYEYLGSGTNHLGCELKLELSEEIVDNKDKGYIYESPVGGKTTYRREFGKTGRVLVEKGELK